MLAPQDSGSYEMLRFEYAGKRAAVESGREEGYARGAAGEEEGGAKSQDVWAFQRPCHHYSTVRVQRPLQAQKKSGHPAEIRRYPVAFGPFPPLDADCLNASTRYAAEDALSTLRS